jgi:hypothetical protein
MSVPDMPFATGAGDYTKERETLFADLTLDEILAEVKKPPSPDVEESPVET